MVKGNIFKIQRFSISDGPGIRTTIFFKGCSLKCQWCGNPEGQNPDLELMYHSVKCLDGCHACLDICQPKAISKQANQAILHRKLCTDCFMCIKVCSPQALTQVGKTLTLEGVMKEVERDEPFYGHSGGGVTLSGGDPLFQPEFTKQLLRMCKQRSFHTIVDTTGYVPWATLKEILSYTDLILYDIKHMDPKKHRDLTGVDNTLILQNVLSLNKASFPMVVRLPLIPGINDSEDNLKALIQFVKGLPSVLRIEIIPYHRLGLSKYEALGRNYFLTGVIPPSKELVRRVRSFLASSGVPVAVA